MWILAVVILHKILSTIVNGNTTLVRAIVQNYRDLEGLLLSVGFSLLAVVAVLLYFALTKVTMTTNEPLYVVKSISLVVSATCNMFVANYVSRILLLDLSKIMSHKPTPQNTSKATKMSKV